MEIKNSYRDTLDILEQNKLDAFIGPTRGPAWRIDYIGEILPPSKNHSIWKWRICSTYRHASYHNSFFTLNKFPVESR